jgi:hypothetical protein
VFQILEALDAIVGYNSFIQISAWSSLLGLAIFNGGEEITINQLHACITMSLFTCVENILMFVHDASLEKLAAVISNVCVISDSKQYNFNS